MDVPQRTPTADIRLRAMAAADVPAVVSLQARLLTASVVTQLGPRFLDRFYRSALEQRVCDAVVACDARGRIIGGAMATPDVTRFNASVTPRVAIRLFVALLLRWPLAFRFAWSLFEKRPAPGSGAELLLLFVDDTYQGSGTGTRLLQRIEDGFFRAGIREYCVSVRSELRDALAFYAARGFQFQEELPVLGRPMTYLIKHLRP